MRARTPQTGINIPEGQTATGNVEEVSYELQPLSLYIVG